MKRIMVLTVTSALWLAASASPTETGGGVTFTKDVAVSGFTNADAFRDELEDMVGQEVEVIGLWRSDRIEIQKLQRR